MPNYTSAVDRNLTEKIGEAPSVLDYSAAAIDDGATDATAAIQAGLDSVAARGGGELLLTPGTFQISGAGLAIPTGVTLVGLGEKSVLRRGGTLTAGRAIINYDGVANAGHRNLVIDGDVITPAAVTYASFSSDPMDATLTADSSVWVHEGCSAIAITSNTTRHSGGYSVLVDADGADITTLRVEGNLFENCYPHTFGTAIGSCTNGAWTGGVFLRGDCRTSEVKEFAVRGAILRGNTFRRVNGNNLWMHSRGFDTHHQDFVIQGNTFEDCGLDAILLGNLHGFDCSGNVIRRAGYVTTDDVTASVATYPGYTYAVGLDNSGYVSDGAMHHNTIVSVLGGFIDADGVRNSSISDNWCGLPESGTPEYTRDDIASYPSGLPAGINLGNTSANGGAADIHIEGNTLVGCSPASLRLNFAKRCKVTNNKIIHSAAGTEVPVQLYATTDTADETWVYDNVIAGNHISYNGSNFCIAEIGDAAAYGSASCTNTILSNFCQGSNDGEFLRSAQSASLVKLTVSAATSTGTSRNETYLTKADSALQFIGVQGTTTKYLGQLGDTAALNISYGGTATTGNVTTGDRTTAGTMSDFLFTGKAIADGFVMVGGQTFGTGDANQFDPSYGLIRYIGTTTGTGTFQLSKTTNTAGRVWEDLTFGSATAPGANKQITFNDAGAWGAVPEFTYDKTDNLLQITANSTNTYGDPTLRVNFSNGSAAFDIDWGGYVSSTNASYLAKDGAGVTGVSVDGNGADPGIRMQGSRFITWGTDGDAFSGTNLALARAADGILQITNGTTTNYRDLRLRNLAAFGASADSIQTTGGVTAFSYIGTRSDADDAFVLSRGGTASPRDWGFRVHSDGNLRITDRTAGVATVDFPYASRGITVLGTTTTASISLSNGYISSAEGFVTTNTAANALQATSGGVHTNISTVESGAYLKTLGTGATPSNPSGYGGLAHRTGSTYWYWNGSAWASVDLAVAAGAPPGADTQVVFNDATAYGADGGFTYNKTTDVATVTGGVASAVFNSTRTGTNVTFQNSNNLFSVNGNGDITGNGTGNLVGGLKVNSTTVIDSSRQGTFTNLVFGTALLQGATTRVDSLGTATLAAAVASGAFNSTVTGATVGFQAGGGNFQAYGNGNVNGAGNANFLGAYQINGTPVIDSSRNGTFAGLTFGGSSQLVQGSTVRINTTGGFIGEVFNSTNTGTNITFQNNNSNFAVNGNGDLSMVGTLNVLGAYRQNSSTIVDTSRNGTLASLTATAGNIALGTAYTYAVTGGYFGVAGPTSLAVLTPTGTSTIFIKSGIIYAIV
jgi:hypothetical protein